MLAKYMQYTFPYHMEIYAPYMSKLLIKIPAGALSYPEH